MSKLPVIGMVVLLATVVTLSGIEWLRVFEQQQIKWDAQNECIADKVALGIERRNIQRSGMSCIVIGE